MVERMGKKLKKVSRVASTLKQSRKEVGMTQQQLSMETFLSREAICQQENGDYRVQPEMAKHFISNYNKPWIALEAANEYIGWGVKRLDGRAADLHRSSVKDKLSEELEEALRAIKRVKTHMKPSYIESFEFQNIKQSVQEMMDVVTASIHWIAIACEEYGLSWKEEWQEHHRKLKAREYVRS
jgi:DNA-binding XRE family transcriptional regulator/NTP pyrophosphatase (non-canonical NTP hydrolase)